MFGGQNRGFGGNRQVCKFYLEGRCRYGDSCKNEHPAGEGSSTQRGRSGAVADGSSNFYSITTEGIKLELTEERPMWPLSSYAPGKNAPRQLIDADFEHSPEEMRVMHYLAQATGKIQESAQREVALANGVETKVQAILSDLNGAMKYVVDGKDLHPNRIDQTKQPFGSQNTTAASTSFGQPSAPISSFGQPSNFARNASPSPFGQATAAQGTAFGQPSNLGGSSAFGKASSLGQSSAFGQPSALGQASAFGKPSALGGGTPAFGKLAFGQTGQPSTFGQPGQPGQSSAFGQPSQSGQSYAFGQSSQPGQTSAFGQPSQPTGFTQQTPAFGQAGLGKPSPFASGNTQTQSTFGQASGLGTSKSSPFATTASNASPFAGAANSSPTPFASAANNSNASPFGSTTSTNNASPFGAAAMNQSTSPFATAATSSGTSPFGAAAASNNTSPFAAAATMTNPQTNAFGGPSNPSPFASANNNAQTQSSSFGQPSAFGAKPSPFAAASAGQQARSTSGFGQAAASKSPFQSSSSSTVVPARGAQDASTHLGRDGSGQLSSFKGQPVLYDASKKAYYTQDARAGKSERIWFPDGANAPLKDAQGLDELYEGELGQALAKLYLRVKETGTFENGIIPEIPPKTEWVSFDI